MLFDVMLKDVECVFRSLVRCMRVLAVAYVKWELHGDYVASVC